MYKSLWSLMAKGLLVCSYGMASFNYNPTSLVPDYTVLNVIYTYFERNIFEKCIFQHCLQFSVNLQ